jgi:ABC-type transport system involved in cytochrome bd biosynthesis fused ATPase/permease subunit
VLPVSALLSLSASMSLIRFSLHEPVISKFSLSIKPGEKVAIVGRTGRQVTLNSSTHHQLTPPQRKILPRPHPLPHD